MELMTKVIMDVIHERQRQNKKWGEQNHAPSMWMTILGEEFGELCQAAYETSMPTQGKELKGGYENMRKEAIQVAAVAVAFVEYLDRQEGGNNGELRE